MMHRTARFHFRNPAHEKITISHCGRSLHQKTGDLKMTDQEAEITCQKCKEAIRRKNIAAGLPRPAFDSSLAYSAPFTEDVPQ